MGERETATGWATRLVQTWPAEPGCVMLEAHDKRAFSDLIRLALLGEERRPSEREIVQRALAISPGKRIELLQTARDLLGTSTDDSPVWLLAAFAFNALLGPGHREVLQQLVQHGPVWDGHIISKVHRDDLMAASLASRACVKGEQGFTAANYAGWNVHQALLQIRAVPAMTAGSVNASEISVTTLGAHVGLGRVSDQAKPAS